MTTEICYTYKICTICSESKPKTEFHKKRYCKACTSDGQLLDRYGITRKEYDQMLEKQGGGCAICSKSPSEVGPLCVDHDHSCHPGRTACKSCVRGLLCQDCNRGLGMFKDDQELLVNANNYLKFQRSVVIVTS